MAGRQLTYTIDLETRKAIKEARNLKSAAEDVEDALDDAETAGKAFADGLQRSADRMIDEIVETRRMVDMLAAELDDVDADSLERVVAQMKRAGITADDLEANLDDVVAGLRRMDDVKLTATANGFDDVGDAVNEVRDAQNRATDATHSFVGNAVSELPIVADSFGPAGEAVSQMTEGLLAGEIGMKSLVKAAAGMGAVGLGVKLVSDKLADMAEIKAFDREQVDDYAEAIYEAEDALDGIVETVRRSGKIEVRLLDGAVDLVPVLADAGVTVDQFFAAAEQGAAGVERLGEALRAAGVEGRAVDVIMLGAYDQAEKLADAHERAAEVTAVFGEATEDAGDAVEDTTDAIDEQTTATGSLGSAMSDAAVAVGELETSYDTLLGRINDRQTYLDVEDAFDRIRTAADTAWTKTAEGAEDAERAQRDLERAVLSGREEVGRYLTEVLKLPPERVTEIMSELDAGSVDEVERQLAYLERRREARLVIVGQYVPPANLPRPGSNVYRARGGNTGTDGAIAGEHGRPELVDGNLVTGPTAVGPGRRVTGEAETARLLRRRAPEPVVQHFHFPVGATPTQAADALRRHKKRNGTR